MTTQFELEARMEIGQALLRLPSSLSGSYAMAVRLAPEIVLTESDPLRFLIHEKSIHGAAMKLACYWSTRYSCFGERAFLPMKASLTKQDIAAVWESCLQRLPDDNHGQAVYIIKAAMITSSLTPSGTRALFYQFHLDKNETGRIVLLVDDTCNDDTETTSSLTDLKTFFNTLLALACKALPLKVIRVFVISSPDASTTTTSTTRSMHSVCVQHIVQNSLSSTQVVLVNEDSTQGLVDKLGSFGLDKAGLPVVWGGTYGSMPSPAMRVQGFSLALQDKSYHLKNAASGSPSCALSSPSSIQMKEGKLKRMVSSSSQEQQGSNKKFKAYLCIKGDNYSSQPPEQYMVDSPPCRTDDVSATASHPRVVADNNKTEDKETEARRLKERNALYSRRKYERKKIEIEVLKKETHRHKIQNANLLQEQQRLEHLYAMAMKCVKNHECHDGKEA